MSKVLWNVERFFLTKELPGSSWIGIPPHNPTMMYCDRSLE